MGTTTYVQLSSKEYRENYAEIITARKEYTSQLNLDSNLYFLVWPISTGQRKTKYSWQYFTVSPLFVANNFILKYVNYEVKGL